MPNIMETTRNASETGQIFMVFTFKLGAVYLAVCELNLVQGSFLFNLQPFYQERLGIAAQALQHQKNKTKRIYCESGQTLEQIAERGCGVSMIGDT